MSNVFTFQNVKAKVETIFFQLFFKFIARFWVASSSRKNLKDIFVFQISFTAAFKVWRENLKIIWQFAAHNLQKTLIILSPFWCSDPNHCNIIRNSWDFMNFCCLWLRLLLKTPSAELHQFLQCYQPTRTFLKKAKKFIKDSWNIMKKLLFNRTT